MLINSTVYGNSAYFGCRHIQQARHPHATDSTISGNTANEEGGGIYLRFGTSLAMDNTIVAGNNAAFSGPDINGTITSANYSLIGSSGGNNASPALGTGDLINVSANLGPLANNGGPTETMALLPGSPAIAAGDPGQVGTVAQNGATRPALLVDIGAYQTPQVAPTVTLNTGNLPDNSPYIIITGTGFAANPALDSVAFSDANGDIITGTVTSATSTSLTVTFTNGGVSGVATGTALDAVVTVGALNSGAPVQVATIGPAAPFPTVTQNTANLPMTPA